MARITTSHVQRIGRLLRNPTVQRVLAWAVPIILGWILSRFDKQSETKDAKKKGNRR